MCSGGAVLQAADAPAKPELRYYNVIGNSNIFRFINRGYGVNETATPFQRLPREYKDSVRSGLWLDQKMTAGYAIRFATRSSRIGIRYQLLMNFAMSHMAYTGIKGADLYALRDDGVWEFVATKIPRAKDSIQSKVFIEHLDTTRMHEYMVYLPLYDGVKWMEIGVDSAAAITWPQVASPRYGKKLVFYGTSITQGGCASRTGMAGTSIIQRDLDVECVNLGFSGEGRMDTCMARAMARIPDVAAYILEPLPNCTKARTDTVTYGFVNTLRQLRPEVPIFMVECQNFSYNKYNTQSLSGFTALNASYHRWYLKMKAENPKNLYYIDNVNLWGPTQEGTVDGAHLTDLGFYFYAHKMEPYLKAVLEGKPVPGQKKWDKPVYQEEK